MIDLHCHILPGVDDGPADLEASLRMADVAVEEGIEAIVATPHLNHEYSIDSSRLAQSVGALNVALARGKVKLAVLSGAEVAIDKADGLSRGELAGLAIAGGPYLLLESPYASGASYVDRAIFDVEVEGFRPILAHPERSHTFRDDPKRLERLLSAGALCAVSAGSMAGRFGTRSQELATRLFRDGLVDLVASDAHDDVHRPPRLRYAFEAMEAELPGIAEQADYFTRDVPRAVVAGRPLPPRPDPPAPRRRRWRSVRSR
ncbi:MAG TPA: CpsB/CapC family capsule biosynthesis tyrosine phosphatase [Thermoleophilaceae bacterium]